MKTNKLVYKPAISTDSGSGSQMSMDDLLDSVEGYKNELNILIREHIQNSKDSFNVRADKPERLIFKISRKHIDFGFASINSLKEIFKTCITYKENQIPKENQAKNVPLSKLKNSYEKLNSRVDDRFWTISIEDNGTGLSGQTRFSDGPSKKTGSIIILDEGDSNKYGPEGGAFGVGKLTAFTKNSSYTVFYLNSYNNKKHLIGKTKLESFVDENGNGLGPNVFFGESKNRPNGIEVADWADVTDIKEISDLRTIDDSGLTTIIPSFDDIEEDIDWHLQVAYSTIHSYFRLFEEDSIQVEIVDDYNEEKLIINKSNYRQVYIECEELDYLNNPNNIEDKYNYYLVRPFVTNEKHYSYKRFEIEIDVFKGYKGIGVLHTYKNEKLDEIIEESNKNSFKRTFRLIRNGMLLRAYLLPGRSVFDSSICGYLEFLDNGENGLNEIIRVGETQSHDDINLKKYKKEINDFPAFNTLRQKFFAVFNNFIYQKVRELSELSVNDGEEVEVDLDLLNGFSSNNRIPSWDRSLISPEVFEKFNPTSYGGIPVDSEGTTTTDESEPSKSGERTTGIISIPGGIVGPKQIDSPKTKKIPAIDEIDPGNEALQPKGKGLNSIGYLTKITSKIGNNHIYAIKIYNLQGYKSLDISIQQDKNINKSNLSYQLQNIEIDGKKFYDYVAKPAPSGLIRSYVLNNVKPKGDVLILKLEVREASKTESKFNLIFSI